MYNHKEIEPKWRQSWENQGLFQKTYVDRNSERKKNYLLFAFAYPSGEGLHVGHVESKTALDIIARYKRMNGEDVFFPVGWDAFGLPAENYAVKTGVPPAETTKKAIKVFSRQIKDLGISYDWSAEIATCHPGYYKWTQWLFIKLCEKGLAYKKKSPVNWCPSCQTVLANEQVVDGGCERCGTQVLQKDLEQWFYKITDYKDELISGLDQVDWPTYTKNKQIQWIGRSEGAQITFKIHGTNDSLSVFTTAHDTIYGATFMALAPEHTLIAKYLETKPTGFDYDAVKAYVEKTKTKMEEERVINKEKSGVFTGMYVINPANQKKIPIWTADYVLSGYGTGAIMAVPGHDERDFDFAKKHNLEVEYVVEGHDFLGYTGEVKNNRASYKMKNSMEFDGMNYEEGRIAMLSKFEKEGFGSAKVEYRLRDWSVGRQRYWGAPVPIVYDPEGNPHPVKEEHLPWILPTDVDFKPTGVAPLANSIEFKERVERLYGKGWTPEYDTLDTFVDSSWYFFRFTDPRNENEFATKEQMKNWLPVDFYMIGPEHTVLHLLYSRFITKFLRDEGYVDFDEPFSTMRHQGMILGPDNKKMSKSKGNVINPDSVIEAYGADTLRVYEMFMGPIDADKPWSETGVKGVRRFLDRIWRIVNNESTEGEIVKRPMESSEELRREIHKVIKKISADIESLKYNTAISALMEFLNKWERDPQGLGLEDTRTFVKLLAPFAPFIVEEMWSFVGDSNGESVHKQSWPVFDEGLAKDSQIKVIVQVNGKLRGDFTIDAVEASEEDSIKAMAKDSVKSYLEGKEILKEIYVSGKLVNFVVK
jgi:leucyl-tRNA synthetase